MKIPVDIAILCILLDLAGRSQKVLKLATKALQRMVLKFSYICEFFIHHQADFHLLD